MMEVFCQNIDTQTKQTKTRSQLIQTHQHLYPACGKLFEKMRLKSGNKSVWVYPLHLALKTKYSYTKPF